MTYACRQYGGLSAYGVHEQRRHLPFDTNADRLHASVSRSRDLGAFLRIVHEGRSPLHALRLLRDLPVPPGMGDAVSALEAAGTVYYEYRAALMVENDEGMTRTYNRFHGIYEADPRIAELRELHAAMDRAVLDAYGWTDIPTDCDFFLDYEIDEATWGRKKKPYRYRWPDTVRDEVLARLLALNANRATAEARDGANRYIPTPTPDTAPYGTTEHRLSLRVAESPSACGPPHG